MSKFRTIIPLERAPFLVDYQSSILGIGSCFIENIGGLLEKYKFPVHLNPFGILYNPISIKNSLVNIATGEGYTKDDLFFHNDLWHSFDHHSAFSHTNQATALAKINSTLTTSSQFLQKTNRLLLTFGTANVFINKTTNKIVANCHKLPNTSFEKKRLSVTEIVDQLFPILTHLKKQYSNLKVIFTVSPVRHIKDGFLENQRSKATLLLAIAELTQQLAFTHYFPAYELVLDDLRDYRFFEKDMVLSLIHI